MKNNARFALVTGAASGLGKYLCVELARRKINIVMVDIDSDSMSTLATYLERNYSISVRMFESDLSLTESCFQLFEKVNAEDFRINILVNNAGLGGTGYFDRKPIHMLLHQLQLNVAAPALLTRLFVNDLKFSGTTGYVLNVASLAGFFHLPGKQVYGATKAFLLSLSRSLHAEFREYNIVISALCPGGMNTNLSLVLKHRRCNFISRLSIMEPGDVARIAIDGMFRKQKIIIPGFWNRLFLIGGKIIPESLSSYLGGSQMRKLMNEEESRNALI